MKTNITSFFIFLLLFYLYSFSQVPPLTGEVIDQATQQPLVGANILVVSTTTGTTTDNDGIFTLDAKMLQGADSIEISYLGYRTLVLSVAVLRKNNTVALQRRDLELGEIITIYAEREEIANREIVTTVSKITPLQLQKFNSAEISDVFKSVPAVHIEGNDISGRSVQIWSSNADEVNVYVDGILLNMLGIKNQADISIIPIQNVSSIDVHKGANLTLLGQGAFGGVVNIKTEEKHDYSLGLKSQAGSYDSRIYSGQMSVPLWNRLMVNYFGQYSTMKPEIEFFPQEKFASKSANDEIDMEKQNHLLSIAYYSNAGKFSGKVMNYNLQYRKPDWENNNDNYLFSLSFNGNIGFFKNLDFYINHFYNQEQVRRNYNTVTRYNSNYFSNRTNVKMAQKIEFKKNNHLQLLAEYFHDELNSNLIVHDVNYSRKLNETYIYDNHAAIGGIFTFTDQHDKYPFINWKTFLGVRQDFIASGEAEFTKTIGGEVNVDYSNFNHSLYANYGSNVKFPTLLEKSYISNYNIITPTQDTLASKIEPEYISSYQFGFKSINNNNTVFYKSMETELVFFYNTIYNKLLKRPFDDFIIQTQAGKNTTQGFETSLKFNELFKYFTLNGSYFQADVSNKSLYAFKPEQNLSVQLDLNTKYNLSISGRYFFEGESYGWYYDIFDEVQTYRFSPFSDIDLSVDYKFKFNKYKFMMQVSGSNILDAAGYTYYYLKKRYWQFSLSIGI